MPTVIDALVVSLQLDAKQFSEEQKKAIKYLSELEGATKKHGGNATRQVNEMVGAFKELQGRLLAIGALIAAGLGFNRLTQDVTRAANELGNLSKQLNMSAQDLDAWEKVGKTVGLAAGEMSQGLASVNAQLQEFHATGQSQLQALMGRDKASGGLGIKPMQPNDTASSVMMRLSEWYASQPDKAFASHLLQTRGGLSRGAISALALGPKELQDRLDKAKAIAPTDAEIQKFKDLTKAFGDVLNVVERLTQQALVPFVGVMTRVLNMLTDWLTKWATTNQSPPEAAGNAASKLGMPELAPNASKPSLLQRGWNWMRGLGGGGEQGGGASGGGSGGAGSQSAPGAAPGGASSTTPGAVSPGVGPTVGTLAEQRQRFAQELQANPELKDKVMRIMANEQGRNPDGTQMVAESMMNRALVRGHGLEQAARWYGTEQGGYYARGNMGRGALENPAHRAVLEQSLNNALAGSNRSNYATDNASSWLAQKHLNDGGFRYRSQQNGETFFAPNWKEPGRAKAWDNWYKGVTESEAQRAAPPAQMTPGLTGARRTFDNWRDLGLGRGDATRGGSPTTNNTNSSQLNINSMNVTVPPGADPSAYADGISRRLGEYNDVAMANTGLV